MLKTLYIYHRSGRVRELSYHVPSPDDPPVIQDMFARHPPVQYHDLQIDPVDEVLSHVSLTENEVQLLLHAQDALREMENAR